MQLGVPTYLKDEHPALAEYLQVSSGDEKRLHRNHGNVRVCMTAKSGEECLKATTFAGDDLLLYHYYQERSVQQDFTQYVTQPRLHSLFSRTGRSVTS
jgi:hypothetical protein